ncbi:MAG TPA: RNA polymerase [Cytophagales bacterium]|nr:RNA polymerase [Cytophagales bacterium]HAA21451.1 RNA polymerase [Cytophagales bacterium]HAP65240.1 RNA polymerase [Cytophagales bacterium]
MTRQNTNFHGSLSFEELIENNQASILRICRIYAVAPLEPQDLFQEVIIQAWKSRGKFLGKAAPGTWLYRVALNVCMNAKQKLDRKNAKVDRLDSIEYQVAEVADEPDERYPALRACIEALHPADRSLVVLFLEELPYKEIAAVLGLTENHVAVKMKRIRARLLACMQQKLKA